MSNFKTFALNPARAYCRSSPASEWAPPPDRPEADFSLEYWGLDAEVQNYYNRAVVLSHGGFGYDIIQSYNEFLRYFESLITNRFHIVYEQPMELLDDNGQSGLHKVSVQVRFHSVKYDKQSLLRRIQGHVPNGTRHNDPPHSPKWCIHNKMTYAIPVTIMVRLECSVDDRNPIITEQRISIGSFPIMLFSTACVMTPFEPKELPTEEEMIELHRAANIYDENFLAEYAVSSPYLINGLLYLSILEKDMLRDHLFHNLQITKINNSQHLYTLNSNILCNSPQSNSINMLMTWKKDPVTNKMSMTITIKNPPFDSCQFNFFVLFYMFGLTCDEDILQLIIDQLPEDMVDIGILDFQQAMYNQHMYNTEISSLADVAVRFMNERADVTARLQKLITIAVSKGNIMKTLQTRVLTHITSDENNADIYAKIPVLDEHENIAHIGVLEGPENFQQAGNVRSTLVLSMFATIAAQTYTEYCVHVLNNNPADIKNRVFSPRNDFSRSQVLTARGSMERRVTQTIYQNVFLPCFGNVKRIINNRSQIRSVADLFKHVQIEKITNAIKSTELTKQNTAPSITRLDINKRQLRTENKINVPSQKNSLGIQTMARQIRKFHEYNAESGNTTMRKPLGDAIAALDSINISEHNPGHKQVITMHTRMSSASDPKVLRAFMKVNGNLCNHAGHYIVQVNGIKVGNVCNPYALTERMRIWTRRGYISRYVGRCLNTVNHELLVNDVDGMLGTLMIVVRSNLREHLEKGVPFESWPALTVKNVYDLHEGRTTIENLIREGILEIVTAMSGTNVLICPTIEELAARARDPTYQPQYCMTAASLFAFGTGDMPYIENVPPTRTTYARCQGSQTVEQNASLRTERRKNATCTSACFSVTSNFVQDTIPADKTYLSCLYITEPQAQEDGIVINAHTAAHIMNSYLFDMLTNPLKTNSQALVTPEMAKKLGITLPPWIDDNGLPQTGTCLKSDMAMYYVRNSALRNATLGDVAVREVKYTLNQESYVLSAYAQPKAGQVLAVTIQIYTRIFPSCSNKLTDLAGSKGVVSNMRYPHEMPVLANGVSPAIMVSSATHQKRNIATQAGAISNYEAFYQGRFINYQPFLPRQPLPVNADIQRRLCMDENGMVRLISRFGTPQINLCALVFNGYKIVQKYGSLEEHSTSSSGIDPATCQAKTGGKKNNGGYRVGGMEVEQMVSTGAAGVNRNTMTDKRTAKLCANCCTLAIMMDPINGVCRFCGGSSLIQVQTSHASQVVVHRLRAANIDLRMVADPRPLDDYVEHAYTHAVNEPQ